MQDTSGKKSNGGSAKGSEKKISGVRAMINDNIIRSSRLPMLDVILTNFTYFTSHTLRNSIASNLSIDLDAILALKLGEYLSSVAGSTMAVSFKASSWNAGGAFFFPSELVYHFIEVIFGGEHIASSLRVEGRPFTNIEKSVISNLSTSMIEDLAKAFECVTDVKFELMRANDNPKSALPLSGEELVTLLRLNFSLSSDRISNMDLILPYASLQPIKSSLTKSFTNYRLKPSQVWKDTLNEHITNLTLELKAEINNSTFTIKELENIKVGNTITINRLAGEDIEIKINNALVSKAQLGKVGNNLAIKLTQPINSLAK